MSKFNKLSFITNLEIIGEKESSIEALKQQEDYIKVFSVYKVLCTLQVAVLLDIVDPYFDDKRKLLEVSYEDLINHISAKDYNSLKQSFEEKDKLEAEIYKIAKQKLPIINLVLQYEALYRNIKHEVRDLIEAYMIKLYATKVYYSDHENIKMNEF